MAEIAEIVDKLNAEPFKKGYTLVSGRGTARHVKEYTNQHSNLLGLATSSRSLASSFVAAQVSFDEKASKPLELLQILNNVLAELDEKLHRVSASEEAPDAAGQRIVSFLQLLKYPLPTNV